MSDDALALPTPLLAPISRLEDAGCPAHLVGRCVRALRARERPAEFELAVETDASRLLALFPRAVVVAAGARRLTLPSDAGPLDLLPLAGVGLEAHLRDRDFRIHAVAYRPRDARWIDPFEGRADADRALLRTPGSAAESFAADPVRAVRAARLMAELAASVDPEVEAAMRDVAPLFEKRAGRRVRLELDLLLAAPRPAAALELLERTGLAAVLAPGGGPDRPERVARLPRDLALRWAAWLRGAPLRSRARALRLPRERAARIERLLQLHPLDAGTRAAREARARRLAHRPAAERDALRALREVELALAPDAVARARFEHFVACLERAERADAEARRRASLALDGSAVMARLGCGPGARVGRALRFLTARIEEDPALNEPEALGALLDAWAAHGDRDPLLPRGPDS